jgi:hypothetical protein
MVAHFFIWRKQVENKRKELEKLPLYQLRQKGREVGVKSPTTYKKKDLIDAIINVLEGKVLPEKTNRGRPAMSSFETRKTKKQTKDIEKRIDKALLKLKKLLLEILVN